MRGIAAMLVVLYHFRDTIYETTNTWIWPWLDKALSYGYLGVDVFFVISGFVISYSVRNAEHTPGFLLRFGVRRSIRLDPPYWFTLAAELALLKLGLMFISGADSPMPSIEKTLAHLIYAQSLLGYGDIVGVFWTLCYEVQFYLVFICSLVLAQWIRTSYGDRISLIFVLSLGSLSYLWSLSIFFGPLEEPLRGLFINRWYQFFLGFLAMQCILSNKLETRFIIASLLLATGCILNPEERYDNGLTTLCTSWLLVIAGLRDKMTTWLSSKPLQFLGLISYSLYLIHQVIGYRFVKLAHKLHGESFSSVEAWLIFIAGILVSLFSAWLMYKLIESPALRVCHQIRMDKPLSLARFRESIAAVSRHT